jgi:hypothetical protein
MNAARGYAVVENGSIDMRTVSPTRRGAVVNWLVVRGGQMITNSMSDGEIEELWVHHHRAHGQINVHMVTVSVEQ